MCSFSDSPRPRPGLAITVATALLFAITLSACRPQVRVDRVAIVAPGTMVSGATTQLEALVQGRGAFDPRVSWSADGGGSFADASANPAAFTAPIVDAEETVVVRATSLHDQQRVGSVTITILPPGAFEFEIDPDLEPAVPTIPDPSEDEVVVSRSSDDDGVHSDFVEGHVLLRARSEADLDSFLQRFGGVVLRDNHVPEPPAELGISLTPEQRQPTIFVVRIDLATVNLDDFRLHAQQLGLAGSLSVTSMDGLLTIAAAAEARSDGYQASLNYLGYPTQAYPGPIFRSQERLVTGTTSRADAFGYSRFATDSGSESNVTLAWQFMAAHGITRRTRVAIIDAGFWLDEQGRRRGEDSDLPILPLQYDFFDDDGIADGENLSPCHVANPCFWHGTGSAGVATGIVDNLSGFAGTGGLVADPILFKRGATTDMELRAVRTAVAWGADVVNMSFGGDCNQACRSFYDDFSPYQEAVDLGSRTVFVAAAGNGAGNPATGYDVGSPHHYRPCTDPNVICVGALADDQTTKIGFSNFGTGVDVFAPTNILVMSYPPSTDASGPLTDAFTAEVEQSFGGTSAATPFVSGVIAMMKAIDPSLDNEEVRGILRATAHTGVDPVHRYLDAHEALRAAAAGTQPIRDRFDVQGLGSLAQPIVLSGPGPWYSPNLSIHDQNDEDHFRFEMGAPGAVTVELAYPLGLGAMEVSGLDPLGPCARPRLQSNQPLVGPEGQQGRVMVYQAAAGPYRLGLGAWAINAYSLRISPTAGAASLPDAYEENDRLESAWPLYSQVLLGSGITTRLVRDARADIAATIHHAGDIDHYIVTGKEASIAERVFLTGRPSVRVYDNDAPITLEVFELLYDQNGGRVLGDPVPGSPVSSACNALDAEVFLDAGSEYLVRVSGAQGRYRLNNGISAEERILPELMWARFYEILNPSEPIERPIYDEPAWYLFLGDPAFGALELSGEVRMRLFDAQSNLVAESSPVGQAVHRLSLHGLARHGVYALEVGPTTAMPLEGTTFLMSWEAREPLAATGNLLGNPGAEDGAADPSGPVEIPDWYLFADGLGEVRVVAYGHEGGYPTEADPGPEDRGAQFFAGASDSAYSGTRQELFVDPAWYAAVDAGEVKFTVEAFLGGRAAESDVARLTLTFFDPVTTASSEVGLGPVSVTEREGRTGLWLRSATGYVPPSTRRIWVTLEFFGAGGDGYADELSLRLEAYPDE